MNGTGVGVGDGDIIARGSDRSGSDRTGGVVGWRVWQRWWDYIGSGL